MILDGILITSGESFH